jgi:hypothetical protein
MNTYIQDKLAGTAALTTLNKRVRFLTELADSLPQYTDFSFLNETKNVLERIQRSQNVDTQWNSTWHVLMAIRTDPSVVSDNAKQTYDTFMRELSVKRENKRLNNVKTPKQQATLETDLSKRQLEILTKLEKHFADHDIPYAVLTNGNFNKLQNKFLFAKQLQDLMILAVYILQPALRNDWGKLIITGKQTGLSNDQNYLYMRGQNNQLIMNVYKNSRSLGKQVIELRDPLIYLIKIWIDLLKKLTGNKPIHLLMYTITRDSIHYLDSEDALRRKIPRIALRVLGAPLSIDDFRHLWEIHIQSDPNYSKLTLEQKKRIHLQLLHSTHTALGYNVQDSQ